MSAVVQSFSRIRLFATPWTTACQASLSFTVSQSLLRFMSIDDATVSAFQSKRRGKRKGSELSFVCVRARMRAQSCLTLRPPGLYVAHEAPLSMESSRQEYWSGLPYLRGFSPPRSQTLLCGVPCTGRRFFTSAPPTGAVLHSVSLNVPCLLRASEKSISFCFYSFNSKDRLEVWKWNTCKPTYSAYLDSCIMK